MSFALRKIWKWKRNYIKELKLAFKGSVYMFAIGQCEIINSKCQCMYDPLSHKPYEVLFLIKKPQSSFLFWQTTHLPSHPHPRASRMPGKYILCRSDLVFSKLAYVEPDHIVMNECLLASEGLLSFFKGGHFLTAVTSGHLKTKGKLKGKLKRSYLWAYCISNSSPFFFPPIQEGCFIRTQSTWVVKHMRDPRKNMKVLLHHIWTNTSQEQLGYFLGFGHSYLKLLSYLELFEGKEWMMYRSTTSDYWLFTSLQLQFSQRALVVSVIMYWRTLVHIS